METARSRSTTDTRRPTAAARGPKASAAVLDHDHVASVHRRVAPALVVATALLGDGEVESDAVPRHPTPELHRVLLGDGQAATVGVVGQQARVGDRLPPVERHLVRHRRAVEAGPRIKVVELDGLEPVLRARVDHRPDVARGGSSLRRRAQIDQVLATPLRIVAELVEDESSRPVRTLVGSVHSSFVVLGLERVDVADRVPAAPSIPSGKPVTGNDRDSSTRSVVAADLVVEPGVDGRWLHGACIDVRRRRGEPDHHSEGHGGDAGSGATATHAH